MGQSALETLTTTGLADFFSSGSAASVTRTTETALASKTSADYLTRLEQGRATAPSAQVVESLARALRLADAERDLLYRLAGHAAPGLPFRGAALTARVIAGCSVGSALWT
ncbi:helix-turn-helix transcriptional regulator [Phytohabitans sp. ZYX-F-186]|uniref:Helix-turn-helix transcriptional regulator n=1 Tax=Phytohabitans maris TaxID=3071409 RepID=A0ABU0ZVX2_9ACTN|nr:helix-turn-helix transcriptional regulator [Phytohabitans sp. ZYX-F-186]MDQ7911179.1 helix-turn-helix transcriptional regulator [Phytohabitans sp. ZYX-F-186]